VIAIGESLRIPAVVLDHVRQFYDELAFLIFLARFERVLIFPAESGFATLAVNVGHGVETSQQHALFRRTAANVHHRVEEVCTTLTSLERL